LFIDSTAGSGPSGRDQGLANRGLAGAFRAAATVSTATRMPSAPVTNGQGRISARCGSRWRGARSRYSVPPRLHEGLGPSPSLGKNARDDGVMPATRDVPVVLQAASGVPAGSWPGCCLSPAAHCWQATAVGRVGNSRSGRSWRPAGRLGGALQLRHRVAVHVDDVMEEPHRQPHGGAETGEVPPARRP
jgi:hypothetical protein